MDDRINMDMFRSFCSMSGMVKRSLDRFLLSQLEWNVLSLLLSLRGQSNQESLKNCEDLIVTDRFAKDHLSKEDQVA